MSARPLDRAERAALVEEREFLLRSLDDLEAEYAAGDIDDVDFDALRDEYTARIARVIRSLDAEQARERPPPTSRASTFAWIGVVVAFALLAGFLAMRAAGDRGSGLGTGDIRESVRSLLFDAGAAAARGDLDEALRLYDEALELQPSNVEALTYGAWTSVLAGGEVTSARAGLDDAIALDPTYPDARVFAASLALREDEAAVAAGHLLEFDASDPPTVMLDVVAAQRLRERVSSAVIVSDAVLALRVLDAGLESTPDAAPLHAHRGWLVINGVGALSPELADSGFSSLDRAIELDAAEPTARVYRAIGTAVLREDLDAAMRDLEVYATIDVSEALARELDGWLAQAGLV